MNRPPTLRSVSESLVLLYRDRPHHTDVPLLTELARPCISTVPLCLPAVAIPLTPGGEWCQYSCLSPRCCHSIGVAIPMTPGGKWWQYTCLVECGGNIPPCLPAVVIPPCLPAVAILLTPGGNIFLPGGEWWQCLSPRCCHSIDAR